MTPRTVKGGIGVDFARQVRERNAASHPAKKFKSAAAPKGAKLAAGYRDRARDKEQEEADDKAERIKALEEQMKLGQIEPAIFVQLRDEIAGGEIASTHLIKGLDRKLLERVRRGENVMENGEGEKKEDEQGPEVDDELEALEDKEIAPVEREKVVKKGVMAPPPIAGTKRSRDEILAELKAQRKAAAEAKIAARPELGDKFRSIDQQSAKPKVIKDSKGREVLITRDEHGNIKKKVRKIAPVEETVAVAQAPIKYLDEGVTIPQLKQQPSRTEPDEDSDGDIFDGVGTAYNPLGDEGDDDDSDDDTADKPPAPEPALAPAEEVPDEDEDEGEILESPETASPTIPTDEDKSSMPPPPKPPTTQSATRNYFKTAPISSTDTPSAPQNPMSDPTFLAAIKRAGSLANFRMQLENPITAEDGTEESEEAKEARLRKRAAMLASNDRDLEDMDLGFGSSRFEDEEDGDEGGSKIKLSEWEGAGADDEDDRGGKGGKGKKGQGKKGRRRRGDKDSAKDVLGVLERRKEAK